MREGWIECKECQFWAQYVEEDPKLGPRLPYFGICYQFRSATWLLRTHKDTRCKQGESTEKGTRTH